MRFYQKFVHEYYWWKDLSDFCFLFIFFPICVIRYMEEVVESTLSLLSVKHEPNHPASPDFLSPVYFLALLDIKAVWFKKWTVSKKIPTQQPRNLFMSNIYFEKFDL